MMSEDGISFYRFYQLALHFEKSLTFVEIFYNNNNRQTVRYQNVEQSSLECNRHDYEADQMISENQKKQCMMGLN